MHNCEGKGTNKLQLQQRVLLRMLTDGSVRTDVGTLVTLDTVVLVPHGHEGLYTALLVSNGTNLPRTVDCAVLHEVEDLFPSVFFPVIKANKLSHEC